MDLQVIDDVVVFRLRGQRRTVGGKTLPEAGLQFPPNGDDPVEERVAAFDHASILEGGPVQKSACRIKFPLIVRQVRRWVPRIKSGGEQARLGYGVNHPIDFDLLWLQLRIALAG